MSQFINNTIGYILYFLSICFAIFACVMVGLFTTAHCLWEGIKIEFGINTLAKEQ